MEKKLVQSWTFFIVQLQTELFRSVYGKRSHQSIIDGSTGTVTESGQPRQTRRANLEVCANIFLGRQRLTAQDPRRFLNVPVDFEPNNGTTIDCGTPHQPGTTGADRCGNHVFDEWCLHFAAIRWWPAEYRTIGAASPCPLLGSTGRRNCSADSECSGSGTHLHMFMPVSKGKAVKFLQHLLTIWIGLNVYLMTECWGLKQDPVKLCKFSNF